MKKFMSILSALLVILFTTTLSANACFLGIVDVEC